jgi:hypothetical protein
MVSEYPRTSIAEEPVGRPDSHLEPELVTPTDLLNIPKTNKAKSLRKVISLSRS